MKEKLRDKKVVYTIIGIISLLLIVIGITYAYWLVTKTQTNTNTITSACLDISISDEANDISLTNQFPLSDEDGMALTPYTFTVTNNCNTSVDYQVVLESIGTESTAIASSALKVALDESVTILSDNYSGETTISGAYAANRLGYGTLAPKGNEGSSVSYSLRIWIDEDAPISEMNKTYTGKISVTIGQGIFNPYKEGTLAYDILSNYGGASTITSLSAEWTEGDALTVTASSLYVGTSMSYWYGTAHTFDKETGEYTLSGMLTQSTLADCRSGAKSCGKYTLKQTTLTATNATLYEVTDFQTSGNYLTAKTLESNNNFSVVTVANELGLYKTKDDLGDSYYFRGNVANNYVKFGTYAAGSTVNGVTYEEETPLYWRIVRINGDGTIRMVFDGTSAVANGTSHTATIANTAYNTDYDNEKYVGYTYDTSATDSTQVNSTIKGVIDTWYDTHLEANYGSYIADSIFCNDREVSSYTYYDANWNQTTADQAVYTNIYYGPYSRLGQNKAPKLTCTRKEDRYTTSETTGNGYLSNPVGLLTADEAFFAGGTTAPNQTYYLYSGEYYWTSAPYYFNDAGDITHVWSVIEDSLAYDVTVDAEIGARPVINLKADMEFAGAGTIDDPYIISTN